MPIYHHYHTPPAIVMKVGDERPVPLTPLLKQEYERMYRTQVANPLYAKRLQRGVDKIVAGKARYMAVSDRTTVPWYVIGVMHLLECDGRFDCHLHNGDPLSQKTIHEPKGRPALDHWTWEDSAVDALEWERQASWDVRGLDPKDWSLGAVLYRLEAWNGFGSRNHLVPTAFIWSGTKFYKTGKYGSDGKWNSQLTSQQVGAAPLFRALNAKKVIQFPENLSLPTKPIVVQ